MESATYCCCASVASVSAALIQSFSLPAIPVWTVPTVGLNLTAVLAESARMRGHFWGYHHHLRIQVLKALRKY